MGWNALSVVVTAEESWNNQQFYVQFCVKKCHFLNMLTHKANQIIIISFMSYSSRRLNT